MTLRHSLFGKGRPGGILLVTESIIDLWRGTGREISLTVKGRSMEPLLREGDVVAVCLVRPDQLKRGDMIAFRQNGCVIVHRLLRKRKNGNTWFYCQKGDSLNGWSWIPEEAIIGKITSLRRSGRVKGMIGFHWRWLNFVMSLWGGVQIFSYEPMHKAKRALFKR
jgi:signal peptidase I